MDEKVKAFLEEEAKAKAKERDEHLIELGLYSEVREYGSEGQAYPYVNYDKEQEKYYAVRKKALPVTDEEYAEICRYRPYIKVNQDNSSAENSLMNWTLFLVLVSIIGIGAGIILPIAKPEYMLPGILCCTAGVGGLVTAALFKVIANISLNILDIKKKII